jgi:hypothetical protein
LQEALKQSIEKLTEAQNAQIETLRKQRELDNAIREVELTVAKRVEESVAEIHEQARTAAKDELSLKLLEKDQFIESLKKQVDELKRKSEQGSQQLQGEVQELQLELVLRSAFPRDSIDAIPRGEYGGDLMVRVLNPVGEACGSILLESKRTSVRPLLHVVAE